MKLIVTGSIAFDYLMSFPGKFTEHFLPEHMHRVSLSFLVDSMDKRRGGCSTDQHSNQIASFYTGAMANAPELSIRTVAGIKDALVIISPNDPDGMVQYAEECATMGVKYIWDPGQQCARMEGDQLAAGVNGAYMVICNDYEFELIRQKTGLAESAIVDKVPLLVITKGENGCTIITKDGSEDVKAVPPRCSSA